jgi:hypothetical protein
MENRLAFQLINHSCFEKLEAMKGVEPLSTGLQDRRSVIQLSYIAIKQFQVPSFDSEISF